MGTPSLQQQQTVSFSLHERDCSQETSVADLDPGSGVFFTPGSGMGKKSGSWMNIPDNFSESLETVF